MNEATLKEMQGKKYTAQEAKDLKAQGFECVAVQFLSEPESFYMIKGYTPPESA